MKRTTDDCFNEMINTRGIYKKIGLSEGRVKRMRFDMRAGADNISMDLKIKLLLKAGYAVVQEMMWSDENVTI
jgi:hypothetical protein